MIRRTQIKLKQLGIIICTWLIVGFLITVYDHLVLQAQAVDITGEEYSFVFSMMLNMGSALVGALLGGSFLVFYVNVRFQNKPYGYTILAVSISFILIIIFIALVIGIFLSPVQTDSFSPALFSQIDPGNIVFNNSRTIKNTLVWSVVVAITQLFLQMNSKFGYGIFWNIIRGKYNTPKEENRIFLAVDLNSSTTIAERLGDEKYHEFIKDFFADITNPIIDNKGEIYQYVGDEAIVVWNYEEGIASNLCVNCFFDMKFQIEKKQEIYLKRYGIVPSFKAGIYWGKVIVGEIGILKRDITYSGDVLNTTSRIQKLCKELNVDMIISADLIEKIKIKNYETKQLGAFKLRGKEKEILLSSLVPVN